LGGRFSRSLGSSNVLAIGMATLTAGFVCLVFLHADFWQLTVSMLVFGAGVALCMVSMINVVVDSCSREEFGAASGMNTLFRIIGGSIGPVLAAVVLAGYAFDFQVAPGISIQLWEVEGYVHTWWLGFAFAVIGLVAALVLRPRTRAKADAPKQSIAEI
jgi:predicted MFS family arabinose efflux permease